MKPNFAFLSDSNSIDVDRTTLTTVAEQQPKEQLFPTLGEVATAQDENEDDERQIQEVPSLCMRCHEQGTTRLLLTAIPYFKEIVVSSFYCDHCGYRDTEVQSAGEIQAKGCTYTVHMLKREDLQRQIVKGNWSTVTIPDAQLTIPPGRGQLTTVEGLIRDTVRDLAMDQPVRRIMDPENGAKIDKLLGTLRDILDIEEGDEDGEVGRDGPAVQTESEHTDKPFTPFTITLDDPSGNSFLAFDGSTSDPQWNLRAYNRTFEQNVQLGLVAPPEEGKAGDVPADHKLKSADDFVHRSRVVAHDGEVPEEVYSFPATCSSCGHELETRMKEINIPYFQNVILMSSSCPTCGYKDNEVKSGGAISDKGKRVTLKVEAGDEDVLARDILKSDTCGLEIPEIDLILQPGTLGGRFTTVEGLLNEIYDELSTKVFRTGDSATAGVGQGIAGEAIKAGERNFSQFLQGLKEVMGVKRDFTLILDDPVSNSYLQNPNAPDADPDMKIEEYTRTEEQDDDLGISDMKVEGYNPEVEGTKA